jgi:hypothetical protein
MKEEGFTLGKEAKSILPADETAVRIASSTSFSALVSFLSKILNPISNMPRIASIRANVILLKESTKEDAIRVKEIMKK